HPGCRAEPVRHGLGLRPLRARADPGAHRQLCAHPAPGGESMSRLARRRLWGGVAVVLALAWIFPAYWILNGALQPVESLRSPTPSFFPTELSLEAFVRAIDGQFWASLRLSLSVTL